MLVLRYNSRHDYMYCTAGPRVIIKEIYPINSKGGRN